MDEKVKASTDVITGQGIAAPMSNISFDAVLTSTATESIASSAPTQFIVIQSHSRTTADPQMSQTAVARLPVHSTPSAAVAAASGPLHQQPGIKAQNITVLPHQVFQKGTGTRPILTVNGQNLIPLQVSQGQAIILNSAGQSIIAKPTILPKGSSPDKLMSSQTSSAQVYLPLSFVNTDSKLSVRSIAPRGVGAGIRNVEPDKRKLQPQLMPRTIAPQPRQIFIPGSGRPSASYQTQQNSSNTPAAIQGIGSNMLRMQGATGQIMQAVITPVHVQGSFQPGAVIVSSSSKLPREIDDPVNGDDVKVETKPVKKPCNCTKSQCLKLYCDCFANGEFCSNCNCQNCSNNMEHEAERSKAIKACLERNPQAFHPKIGKTRGVAERRHTKGCHCKRSGCLKNYCECYEAKIMCSSLCKCTGCKNYEESPDRKTLMHLADAAEVRVLQQNAARSKLDSQLEAATSTSLSVGSEKRLPFTFITSSVASATCECLLARAEEAEMASLSEQKTERMIIEEFERSLLQIINMANKPRDCKL